MAPHYIHPPKEIRLFTPEATIIYNQNPPQNHTQSPYLLTYNLIIQCLHAQLTKTSVSHPTTTTPKYYNQNLTLLEPYRLSHQGIIKSPIHSLTNKHIKNPQLYISHQSYIHHCTSKHDYPPTNRATLEPPSHTHNTPHRTHPHNYIRIHNIPNNQRSPQRPYYLTPPNHTYIIHISHPLITKLIQPSTTNTSTLLFTHNPHLPKHQCQPYQSTLSLFYSLSIILYLFYNNTSIPIIWPSSMIHKPLHTSYQQLSTYLRKIKIKTHTTLIKHHLILTPRITNLITISLTTTFLISLNLPTHLPPQHIHPTNLTIILASSRTPHKFHPIPNPNSPPQPPATLHVDFQQKPYQVHKLNPVYWPCPELNLKHHVTNKRTLHTSIQHILHIYVSIRHNTHHHLPTKILPYSL